jgi:hypothetical protein
MNSSNNVNVDLRPGTRLVRETRGGREVMWVEENTMFTNGAGGGAWFIVLILVISFFILGPNIYKDGGNKSGQTGPTMSSSMHR